MNPPSQPTTASPAFDTPARWSGSAAGSAQWIPDAKTIESPSRTTGGRDGDSVIFDGPGGERPVAIEIAGCRFELHPAEGVETLPVADEQYIVGDTLHVNYPQGITRFAMRLAMDVVHWSHDAIAIECRVSVQTDLLDSHPRLMLRPCDERSAVLLDAADRHHTIGRDGQFELFGDFLEKGVIRRARPWLVATPSGHPVDASVRDTLQAQLERTPVSLGP